VDDWDRVMEDDDKQLKVEQKKEPKKDGKKNKKEKKKDEKCHGSGTLYLPAHVALCHITARLAWRPLFQSLRLFFFFFFLL
jgi:hypothetical protein